MRSSLNLSEDPYERKNLSKAKPELLALYREKLQTFLKEKDYTPPEDDAELVNNPIQTHTH